MTKSIYVKHKSVGRPATGQTPLMAFRADPALRAAIANWAEQQDDQPSLSAAVRRLVELGLAGATTGRPKKAPASSKSSELAGAAIDKLADKTAAADEQASRKRRLLKGPEEFQELRADRKKK